MVPPVNRGRRSSRPPPPAPPEPMPVPNRRRRQVDTSKHCCPHAPCAYRGWVGLGNLRANGHPNGGPGRQVQCTACGGYVLETHGTRLHGKRVSAECRVRVITGVAEGLGSLGTALVFEVDPNTVLQWLGEAADQLQAIACAICTSGRSNWTNCTPCSVTSRTVTSVRTKRLSTCQAHHTGYGWQSIHAPRYYCRSMSANARWLRPNVSCIRACRCALLTMCRCCSPISSRNIL